MLLLLQSLKSLPNKIEVKWFGVLLVFLIQQNMTWPPGDIKFLFYCWKIYWTLEEKFLISVRPFNKLSLLIFFFLHCLRLSAFHLSQKGKSGVSGLSRGLRHSQSMIRKSPVNFALPGDDSCVKLQTMRPMRPVIHNTEQVCKYFVL